MCMSLSEPGDVHQLEEWCDAAIAELQAKWIEETYRGVRDRVWWRTEAELKVKQAIAFAISIGVFSLADTLAKAHSIHPLQPESWQSAIRLLEYCRDQCRQHRDESKDSPATGWPPLPDDWQRDFTSTLWRLIKFMWRKERATFDDIKEMVHGKEVQDKSIQSLVSRVNDALAKKGVRVEFSPRVLYR